jgi:hypothetical protein
MDDLARAFFSVSGGFKNRKRQERPFGRSRLGRLFAPAFFVIVVSGAQTRPAAGHSFIAGNAAGSRSAELGVLDAVASIRLDAGGDIPMERDRDESDSSWLRSVDLPSLTVGGQPSATNLSTLPVRSWFPSASRESLTAGSLETASFLQQAPMVTAPPNNQPAAAFGPRSGAGDCTSSDLHSPECRVKFFPAVGETFEFLSICMLVDAAMDSHLRDSFTFDMSHGVFWRNYFKTLEHFRYSNYNDDDSVLTTYLGHPMQGSVYDFVWIENNPRIRALEFSNTKQYWNSRLWAMIPCTFFSVEWLLGPLSESSIGNQGYGSYYDPIIHGRTNGTGFGDFVITPIGGFLWTVGEDWLDLHVGKRMRARSRSKGTLFLSALVTPTKSGAKILQFQAPWSRDYDPQ